MRARSFALALGSVLLVVMAGDAKAEDLPTNPLEHAAKGGWETLAWQTEGMGDAGATTYTFRVEELDGDDVVVGVAMKGVPYPETGPTFSRSTVPSVESYLAAIWPLEEDSVSDLDSKDAKRVIGGREFACKRVTFQAKTKNGFEGKFTLWVSSDVPGFGLVAITARIEKPYAWRATGKVAGFGAGAKTTWGDPAPVPELRFGDKPGVFLLEGVHDVTSEGGTDGNDLLIPLPIVWREQVPLLWEIETEPKKALVSWKVVERQTGDFAAHVKLAALDEKEHVKLTWKAHVLCGPTKVEPLPRDVPLEKLAEVPEAARAWLASSKCVQSNDERFRAIARELRGEAKDVADLADRIRTRLRRIYRLARGPAPGLDALSALDHEGSCTSCANLAAALFRSCGVPARIVSGYPVWFGPLQTHFIVEYWFPGRGWTTFESTLLFSPWPNSQQIGVAVLSPADEDRSGPRAAAAGGVPYMSLTEYVPEDGSFTARGAIPEHPGCDHVAKLERELAGSKDAWPAVLERARASWRAWLDAAAKGPVSSAMASSRRELASLESLEKLGEALEKIAPARRQRWF